MNKCIRKVYFGTNYFMPNARFNTVYYNLGFTFVAPGIISNMVLTKVMAELKIGLIRQDT